MEATTLDLNSPICRACLKLDAKNSIFSIHNPTALSYSYMFTSCISIQVNSDDSLPKQMCRKCLNTIINFYIFKTKVVQNDLLLRQILKTEKLNENSILEDKNVSSQSLNVNFQSIEHPNPKPVSRLEFIKSQTVENQDYVDSEGSEDDQNLDEFKEQVYVNKEKIHQCDVCGKIISTKSNLNQHYRKHTGERPYGCDACGKKFLKAEHLTVHKRTHTALVYYKMEFPAIFLVLLATVAAVSSLKPGECEVCIKTLDKFAATLTDDIKKDYKKIETEFKEYCKGLKNKENRFCYYLGGLEESATGILGEMSKPMSWSMPSDKICEKLKKKDAQICELRYDVEIDLKTVDLKKLKVRDLKKILNDWGEECEGCIEKSEYLQRIEELKPRHTEL